jgi:hypothetical protein
MTLGVAPGVATPVFSIAELLARQLRSEAARHAKYVKLLQLDKYRIYNF